MSKFKIGDIVKYNNYLVKITKIKGVSEDYSLYSIGRINFPCHNDYIGFYLEDQNNYGFAISIGFNESELTPLNSTKIRERLGVK